MKILFINLPYHGHVIPTIGLVQELIRADPWESSVFRSSECSEPWMQSRVSASSSGAATGVGQEPGLEEITHAPGNAGAVKIVEAYRFYEADDINKKRFPHPGIVFSYSRMPPS